MINYLYQFIMCNVEIVKELLFLIYIIGFPVILSKRKVFTIVIASTLTMIFGCLLVEPVFYPFLYLFASLVAAGIAIRIKNISRFLLAVISFLCISEVDYFIGALIRLTSHGEKMDESVIGFLIGAISLVIWSICSFLCVRYDIAFYRRKSSKSKAFIMIEVIVLFVNIGVLTIMFGILSECSGKREILLLLAAMLILFIVSTVSLIFYSSIVDVKKYKNLDEMNRVYLNAQKEHYEKIKEHDKESRCFRHDMNNHFLVLGSFLESGDIDKAKEYMQELYGKFKNIRFEIQTGNDIVDSIVNDKAEKAKDKEIKIKWEGMFPASISLTNLDTCTIFANALDNAIEACERYEGERNIEISVQTYDNFLRILISNPTVPNTGLCITKKNKKAHGFGLKNITSCVEKNGGQVDIQIRENRFVLDMIVRAFD